MSRRKPSARDPLSAGCFGIWGRRGSGKSTWLKQRLAEEPRAIVFDPMGEYGDHGFKLFRSQRELARHVLAHWGAFRVAYVPAAGAEAAELSSLSWWLAGVQDRAKEQGKRWEIIAFAIEELNLSFRLQGEGRCTGFAELCSRGRHRGIEMYGVSQRLPEVSRRFRDNCTDHVIFCQARSKAREAALEIDAEEADVLRLEPLDYLHSAGGQVLRSRVTFR